MEVRRISKQELQEIYGVTSKTISVWVSEYGLPLIQLSPHKAFIRLNELVAWEDKSRRSNNEVKQTKTFLTNGDANDRKTTT